MKKDEILRGVEAEEGAHVAGEHVEGDDVLVGVLREDDGSVLLGRLPHLGIPRPRRRRRLLLRGVHLLDAPPLLALKLLPLSVRDPHRVGHPARQRALERRPLRVPGERRLRQQNFISSWRKSNRFANRHAMPRSQGGDGLR